MVTQLLTPQHPPTCPVCGREALEYVGPLLDRGSAVGADAVCPRGHRWAVAWRRRMDRAAGRRSSNQVRGGDPAA